MRELWAQALYRLEDLREPMRLAIALFWLVALLLYGIIEWSLGPASPVASAGSAAIARELIAIALLLPWIYALARRMPLDGPRPLLVHAVASLAFAVIVSAVALLRSPTELPATEIGALAGTYFVLLALRWAYLALRGPEEQPAEQLTLDLARPLAPTASHRERFVVTHRGREVVVPARDVNWIQAAGHEVILHLASASYRVRESMQAIEQSLDPSLFVRVHRSRIVNLDRVRAIHPWAYGDYRIVMQDGTIVNYSRVYRGRLEGAIT